MERALWVAVREARQVREVIVPIGAAPEPWTLISQQAEGQSALRAAVAQLPERLRTVVTTLYGLEGQPPCTQAALGRAWGLSGERIRQLHAQALVILRQPGLSAALYHLCEQDSRAAYLQALHHNRTWQRRRRR